MYFYAFSKLVTKGGKVKVTAEEKVLFNDIIHYLVSDECAIMQQDIED